VLKVFFARREKKRERVVSTHQESSINRVRFFQITKLVERTNSRATKETWMVVLKLSFASAAIARRNDTYTAV